MEQYISKSVLTAEIERRLNELYELLPDASKVENGMITISEACNTGKYTALESFRRFLDALEVKEMTSIELLKVKGFLVTDKDDYTAIYSTKPNRGRTEWVDGNHPRNANESSCLMTLNNARLLPDIKFNDKPIEVEVVIKSQKGGEV